MKHQRPRRKIVVVLVEGKSEQIALSYALSALYEQKSDDYEVRFPPMIENGEEKWGDFTSKYGIVPSKTEMCIEKLYFDSFLKINKLYPKDIAEIIHIFDMDGAYIEDSSIIKGDNPAKIDKPYYGCDGIITSHVESIVERNARKRENIDYLCSLDSIKIGSKSIPYSTYFFSSNLDHFLHGDANITSGEEKIRCAEEFSLNFEYDLSKFADAINSTPGVLNNMTYEESWDFIRERGLHSIERHTNINHLINKLL